jgi:hypothetical protein
MRSPAAAVTHAERGSTYQRGPERRPLPLCREPDARFVRFAEEVEKLELARELISLDPKSLPKLQKRKLQKSKASLTGHPSLCLALAKLGKREA